MKQRTTGSRQKSAASPTLPTREELLDRLARSEKELSRLMQINRKYYKMEAKLRKSEQHYRAVVESQSDLISRSLPDFTNTFVNKAYCRYFGKSQPEIIGHKWLQLIPQSDRRRIKRLLASLTPNQPAVTLTQSYVLPDGSLIWQQWISRGIFDSKGKLIEIQAVGRDITELKRTEEALKESERTLQEQKTTLEKKNLVLHEILAQIEIEKKQIKNDIITNLENIMLPIFDRMKVEGSALDRRYITLQVKTLKSLAASFGRKLKNPS